MGTIKYIALDLDGTLMDSTKRISPRTLQALHGAQDAGVCLIIASGRPCQGIAPVAEALRLGERGGYIMAYNGGEVRRADNGEVLFSHPLPTDAIAEVCAWGKRLGLPLIAHRDGHIVTSAPDDAHVVRNAAINGMPIEGVGELAEAVAAMPTAPIKFLMVGDAGRLENAEVRLRQAFAGRLEICRSTPNFMEIVAKGVDKAAALQRIMERHGDTAAALMAFGDGDNDLTMVRYAGMGIAMGNATAALKEAAQFVTLDNDTDGIAHALAHFHKAFH